MPEVPCASHCINTRASANSLISLISIGVDVGRGKAVSASGLRKAASGCKDRLGKAASAPRLGKAASGGKG